MAPASNSKTLQQNRPRPTVPKAIVPAIPLPYIQKRKQAQAAREKASEEAVQATQAPVVDAPPFSPTPPPTEIAKSVANDSTESHATKKAVDVDEPDEVEAATALVFEAEEEAVDNFANAESNAYTEETAGKQPLDSGQFSMIILTSRSTTRQTRDAGICTVRTV